MQLRKIMRYYGDFLRGSVVKNLPANAGDTGDAGSIPGSGRSPEGESGNSLEYPCLKKKIPMDRGAWRATIHEIAKSQTQLSSEHRRYYERVTWWGLV